MVEQNKPSIMKSVLYSLPVVVLAVVCCFFAISPAFDKNESPDVNPNPKPNPGQVEPTPEQVSNITAVNLWASYNASATDADRQYKGQIFEISGVMDMEYGYNLVGNYYYVTMLNGNIVFKLKQQYDLDAILSVTEGTVLNITGSINGIENGKLYISNAWTSAFDTKDVA